MKKILETLTLSLCLTLSVVSYASADPKNWSQSNNRCPVTSDGFNREVGEVKGEGGHYYWCYWYVNETRTHHISMRPLNLLGGFGRTLVTKGETPNYYKWYLINCADNYVNYLGFCGEV